MPRTSKCCTDRRRHEATASASSPAWLKPRSRILEAEIGTGTRIAASPGSRYRAHGAISSPITRPSPVQPPYFRPWTSSMALPEYAKGAVTRGTSSGHSAQSGHRSSLRLGPAAVDPHRSHRGARISGRRERHNGHSGGEWGAKPQEHRMQTGGRRRSKPPVRADRRPPVPARVTSPSPSSSGRNRAWLR